ncbi:MAG: hypothetical protein V1913_10775 [Fibrobacterota bacterium]
MVYKLKILAFVMAALTALACADVHENAGLNRFDYLFLGAGAQPVAMGGAYAGVSGDIYSLNYNPAGIAGMPRPVFMADYMRIALDIQRGMLAAVFDSSFLKGWGTAGIAINYFNAGTFECNDEYGNRVPENDFSSSSNEFALTFARQLPEFMGYTFSAGASLKGLLENIQDFRTRGMAMDFGAHCVFPSRGLKVGVSVRNLGTVFTSDTSDRLPQVFTVGLLYSSKSWANSRFAFDIVKPRYGFAQGRLGLDYRVNRDLNIRGGYRFLENEVRSWWDQISDADSTSEYVREDFHRWSAGVGLRVSRKVVFDLALDGTDFQAMPFLYTTLTYTVW